MEFLQKTKRSCCFGVGCHGRKPRKAQKLLYVCNCIRAFTEVECHLMDTMGIHDNEIVVEGTSGIRACLTGCMAQLYAEAEGLQCDTFKVISVPFLQSSVRPSHIIKKDNLLATDGVDGAGEQP
jgi:hypothetical protein